MDEIEENQITLALHRSLREVGLSELESRLYMKTLALGSSYISRLAKELSITRPNLYKVAESLRKKGLGMFSKSEGYNRRFMVVAPSDIFVKISERKTKLDDVAKEFSGLLPDLMNLYKQGEAPTKIKIVRGRSELIAAFSAMYDEAKDEVLFLGSGEDLNSFLTIAEVERQIKKRISKNTHLKYLIFPGKYGLELQKRDKLELRETRFINNLNSFVTSFYIYSNKMLLWQPKSSLVAIVEDSYLVEMFQSIFDHLWSETEEAKP